MEELRNELVKRDQELLTAGAKLKALEDQNRDSQRHVRVLKESLIAKEEHYNLLLADVEELKRNLDERNKMLERKSYQQRFGNTNELLGGSSNVTNVGELDEMQQMLEMRDKRIGEMQRKLIQLDNLLAERDAQLERARMRLESNVNRNNNNNGQQLQQQLNQLTGQSNSNVQNSNDQLALLTHLGESMRDKEKQVAILRDQRDRAEHELKQERDSHERTIKEYKMKLQTTSNAQLSTKFGDSTSDRLQVS